MDSRIVILRHYCYYGSGYMSNFISLPRKGNNEAGTFALLLRCEKAYFHTPHAYTH